MDHFAKIEPRKKKVPSLGAGATSGYSCSSFSLPPPFPPSNSIVVLPFFLLLTPDAGAPRLRWYREMAPEKGAYIHTLDTLPTHMGLQKSCMLVVAAVEPYHRKVIKGRSP